MQRNLNMNLTPDAAEKQHIPLSPPPFFVVGETLAQFHPIPAIPVAQLNEWHLQMQQSWQPKQQPRPLAQTEREHPQGWHRTPLQTNRHRH
jgi:hypothetical protein